MIIQKRQRKGGNSNIKGDQIKLTDYFLDQLSSKYAKSARDRNWTLSKYREKRRIQYNKSVNTEQMKNLEIQDQQFTNLPNFDGTVKSKQKNDTKQNNKLDVILYLRSNSIHIPAIIGDPLLYEEKKIESFREQSILRDSYKLNLKKNKSKSTYNGVQNIVTDRTKQKTTDYNLNNSNEYQSMEIQSTNEHVKIFFKSNKISVQDPQSSRSLIRSAQKKKKYNLDIKQVDMKTLEIQKQNIQQIEQQQASQYNQKQLQNTLEIDELVIQQELTEKIQEDRKKKLILLHKIKEIQRSGDSTSDVKLLKNELNLITEDDSLIEKSAIQKYFEKLPKKKEKLSEFQKHYKLLQRLQIKAKTLISHNENFKNYDVIAGLKQFQEQLMTKDKKSISMNSILNLQMDFKKILIKADIQGSSHHEQNRHLKKYSKPQI